MTSDPPDRGNARVAGARAGQVLAAGPGGPKFLVLAAPEGSCVLTYRGQMLRPERPEPCSSPAPGGRRETPLRPGDLLEERESGLVLRCIRGGADDIGDGAVRMRCNGRQLAIRDRELVMTAPG